MLHLNRLKVTLMLVASLASTMHFLFEELIFDMQLEIINFQQLKIVADLLDILKVNFQKINSFTYNVCH